MEWIGWALFAIMAVIHVSYLRHSAKRANSLNEFIQFLLYHPKIYTDQRARLLSLLEEQSRSPKDATTMATTISQTVDAVAEKMEQEIYMANAVVRSDPNKAK